MEEAEGPDKAQDEETHFFGQGDIGCETLRFSKTLPKLGCQVTSVPMYNTTTN